MTSSSDQPLASAEECVVMLHEVMHCLDEALVNLMPQHKRTLGLASAHLQHVIDLLEGTKAP